MIMNIGGIRHGIEDMGVFGHEGRFGMCIAEDEEASPWEPLHVYYGLNKEDSAVTVFWPNTRALGLYGKDVGGILKGICDHIQVFGFDPGCAFVVCQTARLLQADIPKTYRLYCGICAQAGGWYFRFHFGFQYALDDR